MKALLPLLLLASGPAAVDHPQSYLVSVVDFPLEADESVESFAFATWGVTVQAVCRIPTGWAVKAGGSIAPDGVLEGEGSHGVTWFNRRSPAELRDFVLVTLYGPVQPEDLRDRHGNVWMPATFKGSATISTLDGERTAPLTTRNIRLTPAARCPSR